MDLKIATDAVLQILMRDEPHEMRGQQHLKVRKGRLVPQSPLAYLSNVNDTLKMGSVGVRDRWIVYIKETSPGVFRLSMRDTDQRRNRELTAEAHSDDELMTVIEGWREKIQWWRNRLSLYRLEGGKRYRIIQDFTDYYKQTFEGGKVLTYVNQNFVPYHGGYTLMFAEGNMCLQDEENSEFINNFDAYVEEVVGGSS